MTTSPPALRSLYRSFLRELPSRDLSTRSPLKQRIRSTIASSPSSSNNTSTPSTTAEQFLHYVKAQRMYATLLERYNPGMTMEDEERTILTARRVGMEMPVEFKKGGGKE